MKKKLFIWGLLAMLIYSCNTPNQATKIDYSVKDEVLTYYNKDNDKILPGLASVKENIVPTLYIKNYNPLAMTITVTQGPNTTNYTQINNSSILTSYLKLPDIAKSIVETPGPEQLVPNFNQFQNLKNAIKETEAFKNRRLPKHVSLPFFGNLHLQFKINATQLHCPLLALNYRFVLSNIIE